MRARLPRILVVDDDESIRKLIVATLEEDRYDITCVADAKEALAAMATFKPQLLLVDVRLPGDLDGLDLVKRVREISDDVGVMFLSGADTVDDRVAGLRAGGDDYMVKPFDPEELAARVETILRRSASPSGVLRVGDLVLDPGARSLQKGKKWIDLTPIEFDLLQALMRKPAQLLSKAQLSEEVLGRDDTSNVIEVHISALRRKLEAHNTKVIRTMRGQGYMLRP